MTNDEETEMIYKIDRKLEEIWRANSEERDIRPYFDEICLILKNHGHCLEDSKCQKKKS